MNRRNENKPLLPKLPRYMEWRWPINFFRGMEPEDFTGTTIPLTIDNIPFCLYKIIEVERDLVITETGPVTMIKVKAERVDAPEESSTVEDQGTD